MKLVFTLAASALLATVPITASPINPNSFVDTAVSKRDTVVVRSAAIPYGNIHPATAVVARQPKVSEASDEADSDVDEFSKSDVFDYATSDSEIGFSDDEATDDNSTGHQLTTREDEKCPPSKMNFCRPNGKCICLECIPDEQRQRCHPDFTKLPPDWRQNQNTKRLTAAPTSDSGHDNDDNNDLLPDHDLPRRGSHTAEYWKTHSNPVGSHTSDYWKTHSNRVDGKERRSPGHPGIKCTKPGEFPHCPPGITYRNTTVETCSCATYQYDTTKKAHYIQIMGPAELDESDARNPKRSVGDDDNTDVSDKPQLYYGTNSKRDDFRFEIELQLPDNIAKLVAPKKRDLADSITERHANGAAAAVPVIAERMATDLPAHDLLDTRGNNGYGIRETKCEGYGMIAGFCLITGECYCMWCDNFPSDCGFKLVKGVGDKSNTDEAPRINEMPKEGPFNMEFAIPGSSNKLGCPKSWGGLCTEDGCFCMVCTLGMNNCQMKKVRDSKPKRRREIGGGGGELGDGVDDVQREEKRGDEHRVHRISPIERPATVSRRSDKDNEKRGGSNGVHRTSPFGRPGPVTVGRRKPMPIADDHTTLQKRESKGLFCKDSQGAFCFAKDHCFCFRCNKFPKDGCKFENRRFFKKGSKREVSNDTTVSPPEEQSEEAFKPGVVDIVYLTNTSGADAPAFTVTRNTEDVPNRNTTMMDREHEPKVFRRGGDAHAGGMKKKTRSPFGMHHAVPSVKGFNTTEQESNETVEAEGGEGPGAGRTDMHAIDKPEATLD